MAPPPFSTFAAAAAAAAVLLAAPALSSPSTAAAAASLPSARAAPAPMTLYLLDLGVYPRARAIDGSPGAFYFVEGTTDDWVFELEGGT